MSLSIAEIDDFFRSFLQFKNLSESAEEGYDLLNRTMTALVQSSNINGALRLEFLLGVPRSEENAAEYDEYTRSSTTPTFHFRGPRSLNASREQKANRFHLSYTSVLAHVSCLFHLRECYRTARPLIVKLR